MRLAVATWNLDKAKEISLYLQNLPIEIVTLDQLLPDRFEPEETGATFLANAELKAVEYGNKIGFLTLADDSGIEVAALNGQPGVRSKRFIEGTDAQRNEYMLSLMKHESDRRARFVCVLVLYDPQTGSRHDFTGVVNGTLGFVSSGDQGFGYDPLFIPEGYTQTFGQLGIAEKNHMSHRARALQNQQTYFKQEIFHEQ